jgi:radial spoke head protein 9
MSVDPLSTSFGGFGLNSAQSLLVTNSLKKILLQEKLTNIHLWGKIFGRDKDYLIAYSIIASNPLSKKFYFSNDGGIQFGSVPPLDDWIIDHTNNNNNVSGMFTGDPSHVLSKESQENEEEHQPNDDDDNDESEQKNKQKITDPAKRKLTELDRLSSSVNAIDHCTCIVPRGVNYVTPIGEVVTNSNFKGLSRHDSVDLKSYLLNRVAEETSTKIRISKQKLSNNFDFLDSLADLNNLPGSWCIDVSESGESVRLRNLEWIGYEFHLEINTKKYVGAYFGDGQKNADIMFML